MKQKILILGASSFLGRSIIKNLDGFEYTTLSVRPKIAKNSPIKIYDYLSNDILVKFLEEKEFYALLFLSWPLSPPHNSIEHSLFASFAVNVCQIFSIINPHAHIYFSGSIHETGYSSGLVQNSFPKDKLPKTLYGCAKRFVWDSLQKFCPDKLCWVRFSNIYGPGDHPNKVINMMLNAVINNEKFTLKNSNAFVDYVHIEDAAQGACRAIKTNYSGVINIGSGTGYYLNDMQKFLLNSGSVLRKSSSFTHGPVLNIELAEKLFDYKPQISLKQGLNEILHMLKMESTNNGC